MFKKSLPAGHRFGSEADARIAERLLTDHGFTVKYAGYNSLTGYWSVIVQTESVNGIEAGKIIQDNWRMFMVED